MTIEKLPFPSLPWVPGLHPLERKKPSSTGGAVLLDFAPGFEDPAWCRNGHAGFVLQGALGLHLAGGTDLVVSAGEGFVLDAGEAHRAYNAGAGSVQVFIAPRPAAPGG